MWTVSVKAGQSELNGTRTAARTKELRTDGHHMTLNLYMGNCQIKLQIGVPKFSILKLE